jgi:ATP-dependent protease ClpP protease subunit
MKTFYFHKEFDQHSAEELLKWLSDTESGEIYINSLGGSNNDAQLLADALEKRKGSFSLTGVGHLASMAFVFFMEYGGSKRLLEHTTGMIHMPSFCEITIGINGLATTPDGVFHLAEGKRYVQPFMERLRRIGLTKRELREVSENRDVFFTPERMVELMNCKSKK